MSSEKIKKLDDKDYEQFIKELVGEEYIDLNEPQKKD